MEFLPEEELEDAHLLEGLSEEPLGSCVLVSASGAQGIFRIRTTNVACEIF